MIVKLVHLKTRLEKGRAIQIERSQQRANRITTNSVRSLNGGRRLAAYHLRRRHDDCRLTATNEQREGGVRDNFRPTHKHLRKIEEEAPTCEELS